MDCLWKNSYIHIKLLVDCPVQQSDTAFVSCYERKIVAIQTTVLKEDCASNIGVSHLCDWTDTRDRPLHNARYYDIVGLIITLNLDVEWALLKRAKHLSHKSIGKVHTILQRRLRIIKFVDIVDIFKQTKQWSCYRRVSHFRFHIKDFCWRQTSPISQLMGVSRLKQDWVNIPVTVEQVSSSISSSGAAMTSRRLNTSQWITINA